MRKLIAALLFAGNIAIALQVAPAYAALTYCVKAAYYKNFVAIGQIVSCKQSNYPSCNVLPAGAWFGGQWGTKGTCYWYYF